MAEHSKVRQSFTVKPVPPSKRGLDIIASSVGLIVLSPLIAIISLAILLKAGRPVFFSQVRPGYGGKLFTLYKFRTMHCSAQDSPETDAVRLFKLGQFLRSTSLDELPELWNVLKGEMSLVGPRPLLIQYLERYSAEQARRHSVLPGITGWAQINGRNAISWPQKFALDLWYVDHWSFLLDLRIILMTLIKVFKREGISQAGQATASEFMGNEE